MSSTASLPAIALSAASPADIDTDLLAVPIFEGDDMASDLRAIDAATGRSADARAGIPRAPGQAVRAGVTPIISDWRPSRVAFVGAGPRSEFTTERLRRVAGAAALGARQRRVQRLAWLNRGDMPLRRRFRPPPKGLRSLHSAPDRYKSGERGAPPIDQVLIIGSLGRPPGRARGRHRARPDSGGVLQHCPRELSNEPSNVLTPAIFAERATEICEAAGSVRRGP